MNWTNIQLIVSREIRDQLRDRRTIFVIAVLPLLLYPLLGMSFLQVAQFMRQHQTKVWLIGVENLPADPALLVEGTFQTDLLSMPSDTSLFEIDTMPLPAGEDVETVAQAAVKSGKHDAVVYFSPAFAQQVSDFQTGVKATQNDAHKAIESDVSARPQVVAAKDADPGHNPASTHHPASNQAGPEVFFNVSKDKSRVAHDRIVSILARWRGQLAAAHQTQQERPAVTTPFDMVRHDLSQETGRRAAVWSKILPFIIIIWTMTGAFYPAIDLCAGEKERGTLETLLSSPASRHEIVCGKMLTVMVFSMATSLLNLFSMCLTGRFVMSQLQSLGGDASLGLQLGPPPLATLAWLVLALIPVAALFSALSLALAAMAKSSKEGQYYLMPLMLGTMPLMMLPMMPGVELDLGNSLIPVTGIVLLLRSLIEGHYAQSLLYIIPVFTVTGICCWLASLWAVHQFQDENVLFHESERFGLRSWFVHIIRDRGDIPTVAQAFLCGILLLLARFFASTLIPAGFDWQGMLLQNTVSQIGLIAGPAVLMALLLTRKPAETLMLKRPKASHLGLAALLAVAMHPIVATLANGIRTLYPISEQALAKLEQIQQMLGGAPNMYVLLLMVAVLPAICEELAFRGFILSGLRRMKNQWLAILVSALFFGIAHQMLQQSIAAFLVGLLIGYLSIQTNSIFPCMVYHLIHNSLPLLTASWLGQYGGLTGIAELQEDALFYGWPLVSICIASVIVILLRFQSGSSDADENDLPVVLGTRTS